MKDSASGAESKSSSPLCTNASLDPLQSMEMVATSILATEEIKHTVCYILTNDRFDI